MRKPRCNARQYPIDDIRRMIEVDGLSLTKVGEAVGCSNTMVGNLCKKHGIQTRPAGGSPSRDWPVDQIRQWVEVEDRTLYWVADQLGTANQTISKLCRKHGIQTKKTGPRPGEGHPEWKGGRIVAKNGYVKVYCPGHPRAGKPRMKYVWEHWLVMEKKLGRPLVEGEVVHHKNGVRDDNRPENLELYESNGKHLEEELAGRCPNWTPEGKERIREAVRQRHIRDRLARDARQNSQTTAPSQETPGTPAHTP